VPLASQQPTSENRKEAAVAGTTAHTTPMRVGIPTEVTPDENRVALTPSGVTAFHAAGHQVLVQAGAGLGSALADDAYERAGATVVADAAAVWEDADLVLKVKEPLAGELECMRPDQVVFTYLHLAASQSLTEALLERRVVAIAYETVQLADGTLPLLVPMSEVAGRLSVQAGATSLEMIAGGKGILLPGVSGVRRGRVSIIGAGIVGLNACVVAVGFGADVTVVDINPLRLGYVRDVVQGHVTTLMSNAANVEEAVREADLVICAVLIPGAKTPRLVTRRHLRQMQDGSALVDVAVDQGGCAETTRPTTHHDPRYVEEGVVHYCVSNMPGAVPYTSTYALTNATMAYALDIANKGWREAARDPALARGVNVVDGRVTHPAVAEAHGLDHTALDRL
jgi:alanine dehydrogenase